MDCVRSEGNPGYSGKQCLGVFGKLSGMHTSWIPFDGIMPNLSSGLQGPTVACGPAMGVESRWSCFSCVSRVFVILVIVMLVSFGNSLDDS